MPAGSGGGGLGCRRVGGAVCGGGAPHCFLLLARRCLYQLDTSGLYKSTWAGHLGYRRANAKDYKTAWRQSVKDLVANADATAVESGSGYREEA